MSDHFTTFTLGVGLGAALVGIPLLVNSLTGRDRRNRDSTTGEMDDYHQQQQKLLHQHSLSSSQTGAQMQLFQQQQSAMGFNLASGDQLEQLEYIFRIPVAKLHDVVKHFTAELNKGLSAPGQTIKALPSYVTRLPTGNEEGTFLALDLGGTNLRVCEVVLEGTGKFRMRQKKYKVSDEMKKTTAPLFFDFIADAVLRFIENNGIEHSIDLPPLKLGFTFSFPVDQTAIDVGTLMHWNKGFEVDGVVGENVVQLLRDAFRRKSLNIDVVALVNDTVGTLITHHYVDPETYLGVIIGTGSNAAYVETIDNIPKWKTHYGGEFVRSGVMTINIEWGAFDNEKVVLPITKYDTRLDRQTENPGKQIFEKMLSGMYLGEIARLVLVDLIHSGALLKGVMPANLETPDAFQTQFMSRIERDHSLDLTDTKALMEDMFQVTTSTLMDRQTIKRVCELVGIRSARLGAAAVAACIQKMNRLNGCTVAIDGSVFEHYPHYKNRMSDALREVFGLSSDNVELELARDGSGVGAALIAAVMSAEKK